MNSNRWQDIYKRQPLPTELPAKFDEAAFLREVELDDFEMGFVGNELSRKTSLFFVYLVTAALFSFVRAPWWGSGINLGWMIVLAGMTWDYGRKRRQADREFGKSLLERIERAAKLISLWRSYRRAALYSPAIFGFYMGGLILHLSGPAVGTDHPWSWLVVSVSVGVVCGGLLVYGTLIEIRRQDAAFKQRLDHLNRVKSRLLGVPSNAPATLFPS